MRYNQVHDLPQIGLALANWLINLIIKRVAEEKCCE